MSIGITRQIANNSHQQVTIPSGNYPWPTIRVLNPNDGVVYVKQNADITNTGYGSWDYKVPSQSFGLLPGEGQGWQSVGLYYLDQSGTGGNGEISIYLSQQDASEPIFVSIGRAIVSQTTSMDIVQGSQPNAPGAGLTRIWSDAATGSLNILGPSGTNKVVLDSSNFSTYVTPLINNAPLGGDLFGTISAAHVGIQNTQYVQAYDTHGTITRMLGHAQQDAVYLFAGTNGLLYFYSDYPAALLGVWNAASPPLLTVYNTMAVSTLYLNNGASGPYIQNANGPGGNGAIRYAAAAQHSFESNAGGYQSVYTGALYVTGSASVSVDLTARYLHTTDGANGIVYANNGSLYLRSVSGVIVIDSGGGGYGDLSVARNVNVGGTFRAGSNTGFMGQYAAGTAFSSTTYNAWLATPITVSFTVNSGASGSIFCASNVMVSSAVVGTMMYLSIAIDSGIATYRALHVSVANYYQLVTVTEAFTGLAAGAHTATIYIQANAGVFSIWNAAHDVLTVQGLMS